MPSQAVRDFDCVNIFGEQHIPKWLVCRPNLRIGAGRGSMIASKDSPLERSLTRREAEKRLASFGANALPEPVPRERCGSDGCASSQSPLIYILLFALMLDLALWLWEGAGRLPMESIAIGLILVLNAGLGVYQESKAEEALARLKALAVPFVWVMRDGALVERPAKDLVPGDLVRIEAGDRVPADGTLAVGPRR